MTEWLKMIAWALSCVVIASFLLVYFALGKVMLSWIIIQIFINCLLYIHFYGAPWHVDSKSDD